MFIDMNVNTFHKISKAPSLASTVYADLNPVAGYFSHVFLQEVKSERRITLQAMCKSFGSVCSCFVDVRDDVIVVIYKHDDR